MSITSYKAQKTVSNNNQQWLQYYHQLKLSEKYTIATDLSLRRINTFNDWSQTTFRTGLGYPIAKKIQGVTGIACFAFYTSNTPSKIEFRPYQEVNTTIVYKKISIQHRLRAEARYFRKISDGVITSTSNFNFRFRYKLNFAIPLVKLSETKPDKKIFLNIGDELFINAGREIVYNTIDNNRLLIGTTFQVNLNLSFSFTYNYQFGQRNKPDTYEHSDVFWLTINHKMALKHKQKSE